MCDFNASAESIFDGDEPVGKPTDTSPGGAYEHDDSIAGHSADYERRWDTMRVQSSGCSSVPPLH
jgi:hypothetical protein